MQPILKHQTLIDFTIQHLGQAERVMEVAMLNGVSITDDIAAGTMLQLPPITPVGKQVTTALSRRSIVPGKAVEATNTQAEQGIEYWAIEEDFVIS